MKHIITTPDGQQSCTLIGCNGTYRLFVNTKSAAFTEQLEKICRIEQWHRFSDSNFRYILHLNKSEHATLIGALPDIMADTLCSQQTEF